MWGAVITGDTVTRLSIPIRGRGKNYMKKARGEIWPKRSEKKKQHKNYQDEDKKSAINKKINSQIKKPHLKMIPIKDDDIINYLKPYYNCEEANDIIRQI